MKILMVNKFLFRKGGSESYMLDLSDSLERLGHQVMYFGMKHDRNTVGDPRFNVREVDFHTRSLDWFLYPFKIIWSRNAAINIRKLIMEFRPDIIHLNNFNFQITPSILYEIKKFGIPIVMTLHDSQLICPSHSLYNNKVKGICEACLGHRYLRCTHYRCIHDSFLHSLTGSLEAYVHHFLDSYRLIDFFISPSHALRERYIYFGFDASRIVTRHNFASVPEIEDVPEKQEYVLYLGRLSEEKGIHVLMQTASMMPRVRFVLVGGGPLENVLPNLPNVELVGFKTGKELFAYIRHAAVTVSPSICFENCPIAILESLSCGTPVIGSNIGGIPELIEEGITGMLVKPGDASSLRDVIQKMMDDAPLRMRMSMNALLFSRRFSLSTYVCMIEELYGSMLQGTHPQAGNKENILHGKVPLE